VIDTLASESNLRLIGLLQPSLRKGSYSFITCPNPIVPYFVCGPENVAVLECCHPEALGLLETRSPIVLCGPTGTGKTTIAAMLASLWLNEDPQRRMTFSSATEFSRSLVRAIKADDMPRFRQVNRDCDFWILDNIHELAGKPSAQEECIATIDHLTANGKVVVITAPELPSLLSGLEIALVSRLNAGHSVPMKPLCGEVKRRALQLLAEQLSPSLLGDPIDALSREIPDHQTMVQLKGYLLRWTHQRRADATHAGAGKASSRILGAASPKVSLHEIAKAVAKELKVSVETLVGPLRKSGVVRARGLAMLLMRQLTNDSYETIGSYFSNRDHTTVMHACKKTESELKHDPELARIQERIRQRYQRGA